MTTSRKISDGRSSLAFAIASLPSAAYATRWPARVTTRPISSRSVCMSSTTRIVYMSFPSAWVSAEIRRDQESFELVDHQRLGKHGVEAGRQQIRCLPHPRLEHRHHGDVRQREIGAQHLGDRAY